jgi:hypothetical protein
MIGRCWITRGLDEALSPPAEVIPYPYWTGSGVSRLFGGNRGPKPSKLLVWCCWFPSEVSVTENGRKQVGHCSWLIVLQLLEEAFNQAV